MHVRLYLTILNLLIEADPMATRSDTWDLSACKLDRGFESLLGHGCLSLVFLRCVVLCRFRPCDGLIPRPGSPTVCRKYDYETE
jgi:hypothetical protein